MSPKKESTAVVTNLYRIGQLEKSYEKLDDKIDKILSNHLPHVELAIVELKTRINVLTAVNIGALLLTIVIQRFFT